MRALPRLLLEFPDLQYWVLGEGPHREALEAEAAQLGLACHVRFLRLSQGRAGRSGGRRRRHALLSYGEAFPLAVLDAWR